MKELKFSFIDICGGHVHNLHTDSSSTSVFVGGKQYCLVAQEGEWYSKHAVANGVQLSVANMQKVSTSLFCNLVNTTSTWFSAVPNIEPGDQGSVHFLRHFRH